MTAQPMMAAAAVATPELPERKPLQVQWCSVNLATGRRGAPLILAERPSFGRTICTPTDTNVAVVAVDNSGQQVPGWETGTRKGLTALVPLDVETDQPVGGWAGMVTRRRRSIGSSTITCDLTTLEAYLDRRYITGSEFTAEDEEGKPVTKVGLRFDDVDEAEIIRGILAEAGVPGGAFVIDVADTGVIRSREYLSTDDKTALSALTELSQVIDGSEFTAEARWADDSHTVMEFVVRSRPRLGRQLDEPEVVLTFPGNIVDGELVEDFTAEYGANDVLASSSGQGDARPESDHQVAEDLLSAGWLRFEHRFLPSTSITRKSTLNAHAATRLTQMRDGMSQLTLECDLDAMATLPNLGDSVTAHIQQAPTFPAGSDADGFPTPGYDAVVDCIGWTVDLAARRWKPEMLEVG